MTEVLITGVSHLVTMDRDRRILRDVDVRLRDGQVVEIGTGLETSGQTVGGRGCAGRWGKAP